MYYNARYYDLEIGQFISPDSIVPDPTNVFAYNRYMYVYGNPLNATDPSGHKTIADAMYGGGGPLISLGQYSAHGTAARLATEAAIMYRPLAINLALYADKLPAVGDAINSLDSLLHMAEQASHSSAQQNTGNGGNAGNPNGFDPNDPWESFRNLGLQNKDIQELRNANNSSGFNLEKAYSQARFFQQQNIQISGHALKNVQARNFSAQQILNVYNRTTGLGTQVYESGGNYVVWSKSQKLAVFIDRSTREIATVMGRTKIQNTWTNVSPQNVPSWLQVK